MWNRSRAGRAGGEKFSISRIYNNLVARGIISGAAPSSQFGYQENSGLYDDSYPDYPPMYYNSGSRPGGTFLLIRTESLCLTHFLWIDDVSSGGSSRPQGSLGGQMRQTDIAYGK